VPLSTIYMLAAPSTPDAALESVAMRVGGGEKLSVAEVKDVIVNSRRASPLRHKYHIANQTLREIRPGVDVGKIVDRHLDGLEGEARGWAQHVIGSNARSVC
jgi:hypothetical protein